MPRSISGGSGRPGSTRGALLALGAPDAPGASRGRSASGREPGEGRPAIGSGAAEERPEREDERGDADDDRDDEGPRGDHEPRSSSRRIRSLMTGSTATGGVRTP